MTAEQVAQDIFGAKPFDWPAPERRSDLAADALMRQPEENAPDWREGFFVVPRLPGLEREEDRGVEDEA